MEKKKDIKKEIIMDYTKYLARRWGINHEHINKHCRIPIPPHEKLESEFLLAMMAYGWFKLFK